MILVIVNAVKGNNDNNKGKFSFTRFDSTVFHMKQITENLSKNIPLHLLEIGNETPNTRRLMTSPTDSIRMNPSIESTSEPTMVPTYYPTFQTSKTTTLMESKQEEQVSDTVSTAIDDGIHIKQLLIHALSVLIALALFSILIFIAAMVQCGKGKKHDKERESFIAVDDASLEGANDTPSSLTTNVTISTNSQIDGQWSICR